LTKLRKAFVNRPTQSSNESESRIQSLTQTIISKQNTLENVTAERNALRLQMEKLTDQYEATLNQIRLNRPHIINQSSISINETDDGRFYLIIQICKIPNLILTFSQVSCTKVYA
jgi:hypothetical protein